MKTMLAVASVLLLGGAAVAQTVQLKVAPPANPTGGNSYQGSGGQPAGFSSAPPVSQTGSAGYQGSAGASGGQQSSEPKSPTGSQAYQGTAGTPQK